MVKLIKIINLDISTIKIKLTYYQSIYSGKKMRLFKKKDSWRINNSHNKTAIVRCFDTTRVVVGKRSYGALAIEAYSDDNSKLIIGNYVSIGPDVHFILGSEHPYKGISTFPFKVKLGLQKLEAKSKGDIVIDDDVWIGLGAIICSGVHIGQGAIIAAGAVVTKNVEPYSIVGGNPAKHIKYRFNDNIRRKLINFDFSKIDEQKFKENIDYVYEELTDENIDDILRKLGEEK